MRKNHRIILVAIGFFFTFNLFIVTSAFALQQYIITDIGACGGFNGKINDEGQVIGGAGVWNSENGWQDIGFYPIDINNNGQVIGSHYFWENGTITNLYTPGGPNWGPRALNNLGQVVGGGWWDVYLWDNGQLSIIDIDSENCFDFDVFDINDSGQITGMCYGSGAKFFVLDNGLLTVINPPYISYPMGYARINEFGQIAGWFESLDIIDGYGRIAFFWDGDKIVDLGNLNNVGAIIPPPYYLFTKAWGLNNLGQIVGFSEIPIFDEDGDFTGYTSRAFLWQSGKMYDLNDLILDDGYPKPILVEAQDINNKGQILATSDWSSRCYILDPIIPATIDIKPKDDANRINLKNEKVAVAILSTPDFNAPSRVDQKSLTFGATGDEQSLISCKRKPKDVNQDGVKDDLVCHFYTHLAGFKCGDTVGILKGKTADGIPIEGSDSVRIIPCK